MYIAALSMVINKSKVRTATSMAVMKIYMNAGKENVTQITKMIKNVAVDLNFQEI